jgi:hypothetical protein
MEASFTCCHCKAVVPSPAGAGTAHRNHCNTCLWSKHVDVVPGDRQDPCGGCMEPIGITLKREGKDTYGNERLGDVMLVHRCSACGRININRIAGDDPEEKIVEVFEKSKSAPGVDTLAPEHKPLLMERLFGKQ